MEKNPAKELLDTALHPVRMRVLMALAGSPGMTPLQLAEQLSDVPQATLYRHINRLAKVGLLSVVDERPVRGTLEKVYALSQTQSAHLGAEAMATLNKEDHLRYFTAFIMTLLDQFSRYVNSRETVDLAADGVGYVQVPVFMSDEDLLAFSQALNQAILPYLQPPPEGVRRTRRIFTTVMIPEVTGPHS